LCGKEKINTAAALTTGIDNRGGLTWRLADCGLRWEDWDPEKGGRDRGGAMGCLGVRKGADEELPVDETTERFTSMQLSDRSLL